jgi:hypothetical protein
MSLTDYELALYLAIYTTPYAWGGYWAFMVHSIHH